MIQSKSKGRTSERGVAIRSGRGAWILTPELNLSWARARVFATQIASKLEILQPLCRLDISKWPKEMSHFVCMLCGQPSTLKHFGPVYDGSNGTPSPQLNHIK